MHQLNGGGGRIEAIRLNAECFTGRAATIGYDRQSDRYLVVFGVYQENRILGQFITTAGTRDGDAFTIADGLTSRPSPVITYAFGRFVVAWVDAGNAVAKIVDDDGTVCEQTLIIAAGTAPGGISIDFANSQDGLVAAWVDNRNLGDGQQDIYARAIGFGPTCPGDVDESGNVEVNGTMVHSSDRNRNENFSAVESGATLEAVVALPIQQWNLIDDEEDTPHLGPMAQDFYAAFGLGTDDPAVIGLYDDLLALMHERHIDFTSAWRQLSAVVRGDETPFRMLFVGDEADGTDALDSWLDRFVAAHSADSRDRDVVTQSVDEHLGHQSAEDGERHEPSSRTHEYRLDQRQSRP